MKTYELTLILVGDDPDNHPDMAERCYPEFSDGLVGVHCGVPFIDVSREADSLEDAVKSVLASAKAVNVKVKCVQLDPADFA